MSQSNLLQEKMFLILCLGKLWVRKMHILSYNLFQLFFSSLYERHATNYLLDIFLIFFFLLEPLTMLFYPSLALRDLLIQAGQTDSFFSGLWLDLALTDSKRSENRRWVGVKCEFSSSLSSSFPQIGCISTSKGTIPVEIM